MRPKAIKKELEARRKQAVKQLLKGNGVTEVAYEFKVSIPAQPSAGRKPKKKAEKD